MATPLLGLPEYIPGLGDGLPGTTTLPGTGTSVPAGVEAVLEYNGIYLNIQVNADRYRISGIDGLGDADIRDTRDVNVNDDGETPYNAFYGGRTIVLNGEIQTYSVAKMRDMIMALRTAFSDIRNERPLHFRTGSFETDHYINCKKISSINIAESQGDLRAARGFQISLRASNPRFLSYYLSSVTSLANGDLLVAHNKGNYTAEPVYTIFGPCNVQTVSNYATGDSFTVRNISARNYFVYDVANKTFKDQNGVDQWNNMDDGADYVRLLPEENYLQFEGDAAQTVVGWHDSWI